MKRFFKTFITAFILIAGFCLFSSIDSKAAEETVSVDQIDADSTSAVIQWSCISAFQSSQIELSTDKITWTLKKENTYSSSNCYLTGLAEGTSYWVRVKLFSDYNCVSLIGTSSPLLISTTPGKAQNVIQTSATTSTIGLSWTASKGATNYEVYNYISYGNYQKLGATNTNSIVLSKLSQGMKYTIFIVANTKIDSGIISSLSSNYYVKTVPPAVAQLAITNAYFYSNSIQFGWLSGTSSEDGYQLQVSASGKKTYSANTTSSYFNYSNYKGTFTKFRVRPYIIIKNTKVYGAWSSYKYYAVPKSLTLRSVTRKNVKYSWSKVKGAFNYIVYASTSRDSGYKQVKKLSNKKTNITITKLNGKKLKKNKTYYFKVVTICKDGSKKVTCPSYIVDYITFR